MVVSIIHCAALDAFWDRGALVNKFIGTFMQIGGGLLVLLAIDSNLGLFKRQGLWAAFVAYFRDCPLLRLLRQSVTTVALTGVAAVSVAGTARASGGRVPTTLEERVVELERQLTELTVTVRQQNVELRGRLDSLTTEVSNAAQANRAEFSELSNRIETATVGGFKQQVFGVLLASLPGRSSLSSRSAPTWQGGSCSTITVPASRMLGPHGCAHSRRSRPVVGVLIHLRLRPISRSSLHSRAPVPYTFQRVRAAWSVHGTAGPGRAWWGKAWGRMAKA